MAQLGDESMQPSAPASVCSSPLSSPLRFRPPALQSAHEPAGTALPSHVELPPEMHLEESLVGNDDSEDNDDGGEESPRLGVSPPRMRTYAALAKNPSHEQDEAMRVATRHAPITSGRCFNQNVRRVEFSHLCPRGSSCTTGSDGWIGSSRHLLFDRVVGTWQQLQGWDALDLEAREAFLLSGL